MRDILPTYQGEINETTMNNLISINPNHGYRILRGGNVQRYEVIPEPKQGISKYIDVNLYNNNIGGERVSHTIQSRIGYQRNAALDSRKRLIFAPLPTPCYCFDSISYFLIEDRTQAFALLSILNSQLLEWRFSLTSTNNHVSTSEIAVLPIPKISFTTPPEKHQEYLENIINLYEQFQNNQNADILLTHIILHLRSNKELVIIFLYPLLVQIGLHQLGSLLLQNFYHIHQEPSEADVIHDFLAYLAEQMIELNKQKQTEAKGFLTWLERFIGAEIDHLTNKSKVQNYLGDYYKQNQADNHLTFDELIGILKKKQKKMKIDPTTRKEQETLEKEYQLSLNTLLPIKKQLKQCDWLIDEIVYRLYGLTEEEKAIIKQS